MAKVTTVASLEQYLNNSILPKAINNVAEHLESELKDYIKTNWYDQYAPKEYSRTFELLNSISRYEAKIINGVVLAEVFYDVDEIKPHPQKPFNAHMSFSGKDNSKQIPYWIEYGNPGIIKRKDEAALNGIHAIDAMVNYMNKKFRMLLKEELVKLGFDVG